MRNILEQLVELEVTTDEMLLQQGRVIYGLKLEDAGGGGDESFQLLKKLLHLISIISTRPITIYNIGAITCLLIRYDVYLVMLYQLKC